MSRRKIEDPERNMGTEAEFHRTIEACETWEEVAAHLEAVMADVSNPHFFVAFDYVCRIAFDEDDETPAEDSIADPAADSLPDTDPALGLGKSARTRPRRRTRRERS